MKKYKVILTESEMRKLNEVRRGIRAKRLVADDIRTEDDEDLSDKEIFERAARGDKSILKLPKEKLMIKNTILNIKNNGWTPIHYFAIGGDKEILKLDKSLLRIQDNEGATPIHYLAISGVKEILKLDKSLLRIKDNDGYTPIHYLVRAGIEKFKKGMKYLFNPMNY
jgi:ankyrin repeat protein